MSSASGADNLKTAFIGDGVATSLDVKQLKVGPRGTPNAGWVTFNRGVFSAVAPDPTFGGTFSKFERYRLIGTTMDLECSYSSTAASGAPGGGTYRFPLPPGFSAVHAITPVGIAHVRANAAHVTAYVIPDATALGFLLIRVNVTEAGTVGGDVPLSSTVYDTDSTNGVTIHYRATLEVSFT